MAHRVAGVSFHWLSCCSEFIVGDVPWGTVSCRIPTCDPHIVQGSGANKRQNGHIGSLPGFLGEGAGSALCVLEDLGALNLASNSVGHSQIIFVFVAVGSSVTKLERSLMVGNDECMGNTYFFLAHHSVIIYEFILSISPLFLFLLLSMNHPPIHPSTQTFFLPSIHYPSIIYPYLHFGELFPTSWRRYTLVHRLYHSTISIISTTSEIVTCIFLLFSSHFSGAYQK